MRLAALSCCVALTLTSAVAAAQVTPRIEEARDAMEAGETERARAIFTELTRSQSLREASTAVYYLAAMSDEALDFPGALAGYRDFLARDPGSRFASRAQARVDDLVAHSEGGFAPLVALERVRRDEGLANTLRGIAGLDRAIERFPPGPVRAEARLLVGEAYLNRLSRPRDAVRVLRALAEDASASQDMRSLGAEKLIEASGQTGEERAAARELVTLRVDPEVKHDAVVLARRSVLRSASRAVLGVVALAGALAVLRAALARRLGEVLRAWRRPLPLLQIATLTAGGGALAKLYDEHEASPFIVLGVGSLGVYLAAVAWSVVGSERVPLRVARALVCMAAALAVSFLTMDALDTMMLEGIYL